MEIRILLSLAACIALTACATAPKPLQGTFTQVSPHDVAAGAQAVAQVRWGGSIVETKPGPDSTCVQLISRPLDSHARPNRSTPDAAGGRFVAFHADFYDPVVFAPGREVTVVGTIEGTTTTKIGEYDYTLPRVNASVIYLWPETKEARVVYPYPYYGPVWGYRGWWW